MKRRTPPMPSAAPVQKIFSVFVNAGASFDRCEEGPDGTLRISVRAKAAGNMANQSARKIIAAHAGVSPDAVRILAGHHRPKKRVLLILPSRRMV